MFANWSENESCSRISKEGVEGVNRAHLADVEIRFANSPGQSGHRQREHRVQCKLQIFYCIFVQTDPDPFFTIFLYQDSTAPTLFQDWITVDKFVEHSLLQIPNLLNTLPDRISVLRYTFLKCAKNFIHIGKAADLPQRSTIPA